ncbi:MAG: gliding motility-associated C-terminal domain-containing protein [Saprospiraceae bacterium]|nr:gliding motility-associated C-terminal domain-containing protein [Saprospiraceae bacterium]
MNRFKKHLMLLVGLLFSLFLSLPNFATNTLKPTTAFADSVRLYATRTTATAPDLITINITARNFVNINEFVFSIQWDATKLQYQSHSSPVSELSSTMVDISSIASGKMNFSWAAAALSVADDRVIYSIQFKVPSYSATPALINFINDIPVYPTIFKNAANEVLPLASSYGQVTILPPINCTSRAPGLNCQSATLLCPSDFPYCSRNNTFTVQTSPGSAVCFPNDVNNNVWLSFVAGSDIIDFKFKVANCAGQGIQAAIITTDDCVNFSALNPVACNRDMPVGDISVLQCRNLVVGKTYYIMVDGYAGGICDFSIFIEKGSVQGTSLSSASISGVSTVCNNQSNLSFSVPEQVGALNYQWKIQGNSGTITGGQNTRNISVNWGTVADSICVQVSGRCEITPWICKGVGIGSQIVRDVTVEKCTEAIYTFKNQNLVSPGSYTATFTTASGCDSVVNLTLVNYPQPIKTIDSTVCIGSSVQIGSNNYSVAGTYRDTIRNGSFRGCDSIVILNLTVISSNVSLTPANPALSCQVQSVTLTGFYTNPSNAQPTFEWTNIGSGQVVSTASTATVTQAGSYKFKLTLSLNGISCSQERTISVTRSGSVPTKPDLVGAFQACSATPALYRINNPTGGLTYNWVVTGGTFSGAGSSQININWNANVSSATVCVDAENGCGKSDTICRTVDIAKIPDPLSIAGESSVCLNSTANYSVTSNSNISDYQWIVTNGTIVSGQGTPNISVSWGSTATGRVCLTPSSRCGAGQQTCFDVQLKNAAPDSLPIIGNVSVCSNDTTVYSVNTSAAFIYTWQVPTGASILRGQGTNTILVTWGTALGNGTVRLTMTNNCGLTRTVNTNVQIKDATLVTPIMSGPATVCPMSRATYSIPTNAGITAYKWTVPLGASIIGSGTTSSVTVDWGSISGGNVCIEIQNSCNVKKSACIAVEVKNTLDSLPLTGSNIVCKDSIAVFEVQNDPNAAGYTWITPSGASIVNGLNTNRVTIRFGSSSGYVRVVPLGGCADGMPSRIYVNVKTPPSAPSAIIGTTTLCEGSIETFSIATVTDAISYQWQVPNGAHIIGDSMGTRITVNLGTSRGGQVCARGVNACGNGFWTCVNITIVTKPTVNAGKDTIVCGNRAILRGQTTTTVQTWSVVSKPIGTTVLFSNSFDVQTDVTVSKAGIYIFKFESSNTIGCGSVDSVQIEFKELPVLTLASENCNLEATEYRVQLSISGISPPFTMTGSVGGILSSQGVLFNSNAIVNNTTYKFQAKDAFGCLSNEITGIKNCPCYTSAGSLRNDSIVVCYGLTGRATTQNDARLDGTDAYEYILHDGSAILRGSILKRNKTGIFDATGLQLDKVYYIAYIVGDSLANGSVDLTKPCASVSVGKPIIFKSKLTAGIIGDTTVCRNSPATLKLNINQSGIFDLTLRNDVGIRFLDNVFNGQQLTVNPLLSTTYTVIELKDKNGCKADITDSARVNLKPLPIANAGVDKSVCQTSVALDAAENLQYIGKWSSLTTGVNISTPTDPKSAATNLQNGRNVFVWSVSDTSCPNYTVRDTVQIFLPLLPKANTLSLVTTVGQAVSGNVNESAPTGTYSITRLTNPASGTFELFTNGGFVYKPDTSFVGIVKFKFAVCSDLCTRLCDTGEVRILINPKPKDTIKVELDIPNAITPNGDGKNDVLIIDGIDQYPNNELVIFSRWGDILYKARPYRNDWQGVNQSGAELPEGTYYYVLRLNVNDGKILRGNMTVLR